MIEKKTLRLLHHFSYLITFFLLGGTSYAQLVQNANFEYLDYDNNLSPWITGFGTNDRYDILIDSVTYYDGKKSLHIQPTALCTQNSSHIIYQKILLQPFTRQRHFNVQFKMKVAAGDSTCLNPYAAQFSAPTKNNLPKAFNVAVDTAAWKGKFQADKWLSYSFTATIEPTDICSDFYFGFVVKGKTDINIDNMKFIVDGKLNKDIPPTLPALPKKKETDWLKKEVRPLVMIEGKSSKNDFSFLRKEGGDAQIVALGEGSHGTHEYYTLHNKMIKYLVEELGFEVIAFENDMLYTQRINILENQRKPSTEIVNYYFGNVHKTEEMVELFDYIKQYNMHSHKKIYVEGVDNQRAKGSIEYLHEYLPTIDSPLFHIIESINADEWAIKKKKEKLCRQCVCNIY